MFHVLIIRNVQRVIHVPFYNPVMASTDGEQLMLEERMSVTRRNASAAIGHIIKLKKSLVSKEMREHIGQSLLPFVSGCLPKICLFMRYYNNHSMFMYQVEHNTSTDKAHGTTFSNQIKWRKSSVYLHAWPEGSS